MAIRDDYPQLLSLAVHEFRTPASVVGGYLRMLMRDTDQPLNERQRKMVEEAEKSCARLIALVAELSEVGKLDDGRAKLARQRLDLFPLVGEVAKGVHEAEDREVHLQVRGESDGAPMSGDAERLRTAFTAIFRAILREKGAACTVLADRRLERRGNQQWAVVVVAEEPSVQHAYESTAVPFDEKRGGLGLALPIARRVIEAHGGQLSSPEGDAGRGIAIVALPVSE